MDVLIKRDKKFQKLISTPKLEWCTFLKKSERGSVNAFAWSLYQILKLTIPSLTQSCPYVMRVEVSSLTVPSHFISFLPQSLYKFHFYGYAPKPNPANFTFSLTFEIVH